MAVSTLECSQSLHILHFWSAVSVIKNGMCKGISHASDSAAEEAEFS